MLKKYQLRSYNIRNVNNVVERFGCFKIKASGIASKIASIVRNLQSLILSLYMHKSFTVKRIRSSFVNSDGWNCPIRGTFIHLLAPWLS